MEEFLWTTFMNTDRPVGPLLTFVSRVEGPSPKTHRTKIQNTDTFSPYTTWNNSTLQKNSTAEPGIEPDIS